MSRKLGITQLAIVGLVIILSIIFISNANRSSLFDYTGAGLVGILLLIASISVFVIAIIQIVFGAKEKNGVGIAAGITGVLSIIPLVGIAAFVLDIIVVAKKS
ncbi:MAG: hypothetical protein KAG14_01325 [Mycoplasmataceae bacterium]|nr:hypothetical protein [Mycoplasmataceae bacterium]